MKEETPQGQIIIVDRKDKVIGYKPRDSVTKADIYRVSGLHVTDKANEILLAKRSTKKSHDPGMWGTAVAGTLEKGETYRSNIIKEAREELGLRNIHPKKIFKEYLSDNYRFFVQWYSLTIDKKTRITLNPEEVSKIRWLSREQLLKDIKKHPSDYTPSVKRIALRLASDTSFRT
ncbi:MAG: NUDIX domain-containing protein [Candidatus Woesearchaeota archaeon]